VTSSVNLVCLSGGKGLKRVFFFFGFGLLCLASASLGRCVVMIFDSTSLSLSSIHLHLPVQHGHLTHNSDTGGSGSGETSSRLLRSSKQPHWCTGTHRSCAGVQYKILPGSLDQVGDTPRRLTDHRLHVVDLITMAAMGAVGLGVYEADPAPTRSFPVFNTDGGIAYPQFAYPVGCQYGL
jgi:hypothetical protein